MSAPALGHALRALRNRNYRLFFIGQGASLVGSWMQRVALAWLVYRLTGSEVLLGLIVFLSQSPTIFFSTVAGVLADRFQKRGVLILLQVMELLLAAVLALLAFSGQVAVSHLLLISLASGIVGAFETPIRQSFVIEMLEVREHLPSAIALNSSLFNSARMVGPAVAGLVVARYGEALCFLLNAVSYGAIVLALFLIKPRRSQTIPRHHHFIDVWKEGLRYSWGNPTIRTALIVTTITSTVALPYMTLLPAFAKTVLGGDSVTFGFMTSAVGVGALCGALTLAIQRQAIGFGRLILRMTLLFGVGLVGLAISRDVVVSILTLTLVGYSMMLTYASMNTLIQTSVPDDIRGRVLSLYIVGFLGIGPFGSLLAGWLATIIGSPATVLLGGLGLFAQGLLLGPALLRIDRKSSVPGEVQRPLDPVAS
jgi:MFS family permease